MKHEWRKHEKALYGAGKTPELLDVPAQKFIVISGRGNAVKGVRDVLGGGKGGMGELTGPQTAVDIGGMDIHAVPVFAVRA